MRRRVSPQKALAAEPDARDVRIVDLEERLQKLEQARVELIKTINCFQKRFDDKVDEIEAKHQQEIKQLKDKLVCAEVNFYVDRNRAHALTARDQEQKLEISALKLENRKLKAEIEKLLSIVEGRRKSPGVLMPSKPKRSPSPSLMSYTHFFGRASLTSPLNSPQPDSLSPTALNTPLNLSLTNPYQRKNEG